MVEMKVDVGDHRRVSSEGFENAADTAIVLVRVLSQPHQGAMHFDQSKRIALAIDTQAERRFDKTMSCCR